MDSDSQLESIESNKHLPNLSLRCHCQQLRLDEVEEEEAEKVERVLRKSLPYLSPPPTSYLSQTPETVSV